MQYELLRLKADAAGAPGQWALRVGAVVVSVVSLALSAPIIWAALVAEVGLAGLLELALALAGTLVFQALPWAMQRLEYGLLEPFGPDRYALRRR